MPLKLVLPTQQHKQAVLAYKNEFLLNNESLDGTSNLVKSPSYEVWLDRVHKNTKKETVEQNLVPATTYLAIRKTDDKLIGFTDIRHELNDYLFNYGGNIGYSVRKSERKKGYAKLMLHLALKESEKLGLKKVLITCDKNNLASAKVILANGGILENEVQNKEYITQRYWINI